MSEALVHMRSSLLLEGVEPRRAERMLHWAQAFLSFGDSDEPSELDRNDVEAFLDHLARRRDNATIPRSQVLESIKRLYRHGQGGVPTWLRVLIEERTSTARPNVLSEDEIQRLLARLFGREWLIAALISGTGLRLIECLRLRVRDLDLGSKRLRVRHADDRVDRELDLPEEVIGPLREHLDGLRSEHIRDIADGSGTVSLPPAIARDRPAVARKFGWQYLFPAPIPSGDVRRSAECIHHLDPNRIHQQFARAALEAGIYRRVNGHVLRSSFALKLLKKGVPVREVERILGAARTPAAASQDVPVPPASQPRPPEVSA